MESLKPDSLPSNYISANNIRVHYIRSGQGFPMVLLHGWPEFWYTWRHCIPALARQYDVDNFMKPGNIQGGFNWYVSSATARLLSIKEKLPPVPKIEVPSRFLWGKRDPIVKPEWSDRLQQYFTNFMIDFVDTGHFVQYERPDVAVPEILAFFKACFLNAAR